jgi:hypothetical protein
LEVLECTSDGAVSRAVKVCEGWNPRGERSASEAVREGDTLELDVKDNAEGDAKALDCRGGTWGRRGGGGAGA